MRLDSVVFGIAGVSVGLICGWVIGTQQAGPVEPTAPVAQTSSAPAPPIVDETRVQALTAVADQDPENIESRVQLGNLYYDAERFDKAISWYEAALALNPDDPDVSTDLGVAYYQTNQPERAVAQFERSLAADPRHVKTLLNLGIVRAFGLQDLDGAAEAWRQVVDIAPGTEEGAIASRALESLASAHQGIAPAGSGSDGG